MLLKEFSLKNSIV